MRDSSTLDPLEPMPSLSNSMILPCLFLSIVFYLNSIAAASPADVNLVSATSSATISVRADGLDLKSFSILAAENLLRGAQKIFVLPDRQHGKELTAISGWSSVEVVAATSRLAEFVLVKDGPSPAKVRLSIGLDDVLLEFRILELDCASCDLFKTQFPNIQIRLFSDGTWHLPILSGVEQPLPGRRDHVVKKIEYPGFWGSYQMFGMTSKREAVYLAHHDPEGSAKAIVLDKLPDADFIVFKSYWHRAVPNGAFVLGAVNGDWYDHALIYRKWANSAEPIWRPKLSTEPSQAQRSFKDIDYWIVDSCDPSECVKRFEQLRPKLHGRIGFHWYDWHQIPFDTDYPNYFPEKSGFREAIKRLRELDVVVMPYFNGQLWDNHLSGEYPGCFENSVHRSQFTPGVFTINQRPFSSGCPTTEWWQKTIKGIASRLVKDFGVDGLYFDSVAAGYGTCFAQHHRHQPGWAGDFLEHGYYEIIDDLKDEFGDRIFLTSEGNAEPYVGRFDAFLVWNFGILSGTKPIFSTLFNQQTSLFGRFHDNRPVTPEGGLKALKMKTGQALVFGERLGWIYPKNLGADEFAYLNTITAIRSAYRDFFDGTILRAPLLTPEIGSVSANWWTMFSNAVLELDGVQAGAFSNGMRKILVFANISGEPVTFGYKEASNSVEEFVRLTLQKDEVKVVELVSR
jgi:hypothetical protein